MYQTQGTIKVILDTQTFPSGFTKREFVLTTQQEQYPQDLKFELVKDRTSLIDSFDIGQQVTVHFDIRGNEYQGRYFVNLSCWKIEGAQEQEASSSPPEASFDGDFSDTDDIPF